MGSITLTVEDLFAEFQVIDEDGNSCVNFKYCEFEAQMKAWEFGDRNFNGDPMLETPNKNDPQNQFADVDNNNGLMNFEITTNNFELVKYDEVEGGFLFLGDITDVDGILEVGKVPDHYDLMKVYLPNEELKAEYKEQWQSNGYESEFGIKSEDIIFLDKPESGGTKTGDESMQVIFYLLEECE